MNRIAREYLGPLWAAIGAALRRRSLLVLLAATLTVFGLISYSNFSELRNERRLIEKAEGGELQGFELFMLPISMTCDAQRCFIATEDGELLGIEVPRPADAIGSPRGLPAKIKAIEQNLPRILLALRSHLEVSEQALAPKATILRQARTAGTFWGVLFAAIAGATLLGAEWRWGVWRTLLTHEPRRARVLLSRYALLWVVIAGGLVVTLAFSAVVDTVFRALSDVGASGGPGIRAIAGTVGEALLSVEVYATIAGLLATIARTSFAGIGSLVFLLGDGLATARFDWLRHVSPSQQVAALLPPTVFQERGYAWFPPESSGALTCAPAPGGSDILCTEKLLGPIPQSRAAAVLGAWIIVAALVGWLFIRRRDVPQ